ncbi:MAG: universal stress protein [Solirubrobacteraceae bacterium]
MSRSTPTPTPGPDRPSRHRPPRGGQIGASSAPKLIGVAVDGSPSGRDATVLGSLLARALGAELMLIAVHEEPLLPVDLPGAMSWTAIEEQARTVLAETRDSLAPHARIIVQADVLVWRGLRHVVRHEHRDLLVVGSAQDAHPGRVQLGQSADELLGHLECPLAIDRRASGSTPRGDSIESASDLTAPSSHGAALDFAVSMAATAGAALEARRAIDDGVAGGSLERELAGATGTGVPTKLEGRAGHADRRAL